MQKVLVYICIRESSWDATQRFIFCHKVLLKHLEALVFLDLGTEAMSAWLDIWSRDL